jgi:hypothetical protein
MGKSIHPTQIHQSQRTQHSQSRQRQHTQSQQRQQIPLQTYNEETNELCDNFLKIIITIGYVLFNLLYYILAFLVIVLGLLFQIICKLCKIIKYCSLFIIHKYRQRNYNQTIKNTNHKPLELNKDEKDINNKNDDEDDKKICAICLKNERNCVLVHSNDTAHMVSCYECAKLLKNYDSRCPICCQKIISINIVYIS